MDIVAEILKLGSVGVIAGAFSSFSALRGYRNKKYWEKRVDLYQETIEALSDLVFFYESYYTASIMRK